MTRSRIRQHELDRAVATATGEDVHEIHHRGFSLVDPFLVDFDPEPNHSPPRVVDWDAPLGVPGSFYEMA